MRLFLILVAFARANGFIHNHKAPIGAGETFCAFRSKPRVARTRIPHFIAFANRMCASNESANSSVQASELEQQAVATGYSQNPDLLVAIDEATTAALASLPPLERKVIDLGIVYISSIYDGQHSPTKVVPSILETVKQHYSHIDGSIVQKIIGCSAGGLLGSTHIAGGCTPIENEGAAGVTISLCVLPDTEIRTFHLLEDDVPDDYAEMDAATWKSSVGLSKLKSSSQGDNTGIDDQCSFMLLPAPSFQTDMDDFLKGLTFNFETSAIFGGLASTVSSLSRAKLFRYDVDEPDCMQALTEGCLGAAMSGDVTFKVMVAQGAKPVGGIYRVVKGEESTIQAIQLDEAATEQLELTGEDIGDENDESDAEEMDLKKKTAAAYAKAIIPKPVLAEANYLMKTLSDEDQSFMRKLLLIGLDGNSGVGKSPSDLIRLAEGDGHRFTVHQVASAGMKDGSVTLPFGSVNIEPGNRFRFFVRSGDYAKKEVQAIWTGHQRKKLKPTPPAACFVFPTLDRGENLFSTNAFESNIIAEYLQGVPSIGGFFSNGVIGALDGSNSQVMVHSSASCYAVLGSKSNRPIYSNSQALEQVENETHVGLLANGRILDQNPTEKEEENPAPRSANGELIIKRREIHSGRALTVSAVEWSVAERIAKPSSALEGFMWNKETEVDRLRERVPLSNLVSQCKLFDMDATKPKPRGWAVSIRAAMASEQFVVIPELKRIEPFYGSLRKRYDIVKLVAQFIKGGAVALSVNCDSVLFGGSLADIKTIRDTTSNAADNELAPPPILASDLILYPYQLYKLRLAGADAVNLVVGALSGKDLLYLSKIAASLKMDVVASVTSEVQINSVTKLGSCIAAISLSNRDLETFGFDESGVQALELMKSDAMKNFSNIHPEALIFAEGRVGITEMDDGKDKSIKSYVNELKKAGVMGAIVGGGLAASKDDFKEFRMHLNSEFA